MTDTDKRALRPKRWGKGVLSAMLCSILLHVFPFYSFSLTHNYHFSPPVLSPPPVVLDLAQLPVQDVPPPLPDRNAQKPAPSPHFLEPASTQQPVPPAASAESTPPALATGELPTEPPDPEEARPEEAASFQQSPVIPAEHSDQHSSPVAARDNPKPAAPRPEEGSPQGRGGDLLRHRYEKFSYRIYLAGVAVGEAELEAERVSEGARMSLKLHSTPAFSGIYQVNDLVETKQIKSDFILSKVRKQEGSVKTALGFTILRQEHKVFWINYLTNRGATEELPSGNVYDLLTGLYYLRSQTVTVGTTLSLDLFDGQYYRKVPVEALRKERLELPGLGEVETVALLLRLKNDSQFQRGSDLQIWLSNDSNHAPIKFETTCPLGRVTASLVNAEVGD